MASRHAPPLFVAPDGQLHRLTRIELGRGDDEGKRREAFIQNMVHSHPDIVPMENIEPGMSPLLSVCQELPVSGYFVDNFWITPWGGLIIGECKLVRNPQARREVVAQVLDYARILATWSFEDLESASRQALKEPAFRLWDLVEKQTDLDEVQFVDAVERRLRAGRLLLLIIGDGIQEGVEALTSHLQLHAGIHAGLALLDLSLWRGMDGGVVVVPRVPMRTVLIERGIVTLDEAGKAHIGPATAVTSQIEFGRPRPSTQSEAEYFDRLGSKHAGLVEAFKAFLGSLGDVGVIPVYRQSVVLRFSPSPDITASAGYVDANGSVWVGDAISAAERAGRAEVGQQYLDTLATAVGGSVRHYEKSPSQVMESSGKALTLATLLRISSAWRSAIERLVNELRSSATE